MSPFPLAEIIAGPIGNAFRQIDLEAARQLEVPLDQAAQQRGIIDRFEIHAGTGRRAPGVVELAVLDEQAVHADHADALAIIVVAQHVFDADVLRESQLAAARDVDAIATACGLAWDDEKGEYRRHE